MVYRHPLPVLEVQWRQLQRKPLHTAAGSQHASCHRRSTRLAAAPWFWALVGPAPPLRVHTLLLPPVAISGNHSSSSLRYVHIPALLLPPVYFCGLLVALWVWKCMMLVVFQNKIIYMPGLPPNARSERIADYANLCGGIQWTDERTRAADGTDLAMAVTTVPLSQRESHLPNGSTNGEKAAPAHVYILYFQGNASSIPPRLRDLSFVLRAVSDSKAPNLAHVQLTFVCLSYRGYWTSRGRPSEKGLGLDAEAGVQWIAQRHEQMYGGDDKSLVPTLLVWGQSIGSGIATNLAAASGRTPSAMPIRGLILETPFLSVRAMLETLYPQKWLPYKHLWPFLRNHMDSWANLGMIADLSKKTGQAAPGIYILEAARDELVPKEQGEKLYQRCIDLSLHVEKATVPVAYHSEAIARGDGKKLAAQAILQLTQRALNSG
ncbi:Alpha/Beta hydrolase protein [Bombardia bombarda]|uniref:Alpha/Beta hydrolase protein n=1 Tax=Bombardia bombarda TaxID=252184 RepID=A0AA40BYP6_9PEZI|nr:Alpha/Beta hydrolase protein [Bombardia bombarda]